MGFYYEQLLHWMQFFAPDRFLFLVYEEDIVQGKSQTLCEVFRFLDVDPDFEVQDQLKVVNQRACNLHLYLNYYLPWIANGRINHLRLLRDLDLPPIRVTEDDRAELYEIFSPQYAHLEKLIGRSLQSWRKVKPAG